MATTFNVDSILPSIDAVEEDLLVREYLGNGLYQLLKGYVDGGQVNNAGSVGLSELLPYAQRLVCYMGMYEYGQELIVSIQSNGLLVAKTDRLEAAKMWQVNKLEERLERGAYNAAEALFNFLWENADTYPLWTQSEQYVELSECIISSAEEFNRHYFIQKSRLVFTRMKAMLIECQEKYIAPVISAEYCEELVEKLRDNDLETPDIKVLRLLRKALANYAIADGLATQVIHLGGVGVTVRTFQKSEHTSRQESAPSEARINALIKHCQRSAEDWRSQALKLLNSNPLDYPTFADSNQYKPENPSGSLAPTQVKEHGFFRTN